MIYPHHVVWPAFWGMIQDDKVTPLHPEQAYSQLRRVLRVRRDFTEELSTVRLNAKDKVQALGEERAKVPDFELTDEEKANWPSWKVDGGGCSGKAGRGAGGGTAKGAPSGPIHLGRAVYVWARTSWKWSRTTAQPYAWALAHDVRRTLVDRVSGCYECHADGAPLFELLTAAGPASTRWSARVPTAGLDKTNSTSGTCRSRSRLQMVRLCPWGSWA
jgi:hypothetical protein